MRTFLSTAAALALLSCNPGFDPQYRVTDLRLLAVRARVAEASPAPDGSTLADVFLGQTVTFEALVANPLRRADLKVRWFVCAPATGGSLPPCLDPNALEDPGSLGSAPGAFQIAEVSGAGVPSEQIQTPAIPLSGLPQEVQDAAAAALAAAQVRGAAYRCIAFVDVPIVALAQAGGRQDAALKRVRLVAPYTTPPTSGYVPNRNPVAVDARRAPTNADACTGGTSLSALLGPSPAPVFPAGRATLCGSFNAPGQYNDCDASGAETPTYETYGSQWYVTAGSFPDAGGIGNAEGTHIDFERPAEAFGLWTIVRDGRGGVDWKFYDVPAAP